MTVLERGRVRRRRMGAALGAVVAMGALSVAVPEVGHAAAGDLTIDQVEGERQRARTKQAEIASQLDAAKASSEELIAALTTLDQQVEAQVARNAEADRALKDAERRLGEYQAQVAAHDREVQEINNRLRKQAISRYVKPEDDDTSMRLLKADDLDQAQQKKVLADAVAGSSQELIERLRGAKGRIEGVRQQAAEAKAEAEARKAEQAALTTTIIEERAAQGRLQAEWDKRISNLKASHDELDATAAGLDLTLATQARPPGPAAAPAPQSSNGRWIRPVNARNGDGFGGARKHGGVDLLAPVGTPVWAASGGTVVRVDPPGKTGGFGNLVVIDHGGGLQSWYAHLSTFQTSVGRTVSQGTVIGNIGMTGNTSGPHLHFEVTRNGARQNPYNYIPQ